MIHSDDWLEGGTASFSASWFVPGPLGQRRCPFDPLRGEQAHLFEKDYLPRRAARTTANRMPGWAHVDCFSVTLMTPATGVAPTSPASFLDSRALSWCNDTLWPDRP
jgi:hypothetical protein